jgi:hypothetical protein
MKKFSTLLTLMVVALVLVAFAGCDLAMDGAVDRGLDVTSRKAGAGAPVEFTATVNMYQDHESVVDRHVGNSNHYKTEEETLYSSITVDGMGDFGGVIKSDWDLLDGKHVVMNNVTNYNLDPYTTELSGSNHSSIMILDDSGDVVLELDANGVIEGSLFGAEIAMNWVSKNSDVKARGKVAGTFVWLLIDYSNGNVIQTLPNGTFTLTGTYNRSK